MCVLLLETIVAVELALPEFTVGTLHPRSVDRSERQPLTSWAEGGRLQEDANSYRPDHGIQLIKEWPVEFLSVDWQLYRQECPEQGSSESEA